MKAQLLWVVLLFSVLSASVYAQDRSQSRKPVIPEHPFIKLLTTLEKGAGQQTLHKSANDDYQLDSVEQQVWNMDSWLPYLRTEHSYQSGKRVESNGYFTTQPGSNWELSSNEIFTYDNDLLTSTELYGISEGEIISGERTLITYQTSAGVTLPETTIYQYWDDVDEEWINEDRTTTLVENGLIVGGMYDEWDVDSWLETDRFTLEDVNGDLVETTLIYDDVSEEWINYEQVIYSDITAADLYARFNQFINQVDDGTFLILLSILPDYTGYEWMEDGETGSWVATERQVSEPSSELEFGATSAILTSMEYNAGEPEEWETTFQTLVGYNDNNQPTGMSVFTVADESESMDLQKIFSEEYQYTANDVLEVVLKYGNPDIFMAKSNLDEHVTARALLSWSEVNTSIDPDEQPLSFRLNAAYPNPFNPSTVIPFQMATASDVSIEVFDMIGRNVATLVDEFKPAGNHTVRFDGAGLSSGVYMIRFTAADVQQTRSVSLIK